MISPLSPLFHEHRVTQERREAALDRARHLRRQTDELFSLNADLQESQRNLDVRSAELDDRERRLRRAERELEKQSRAVANREAAIAREREREAMPDLLRAEMAEEARDPRSPESVPATEGSTLTDREQDAMAAAILRAGAIRRGELRDDPPLPDDPVARAIVLAGMKRRGELVEDEPQLARDQYDLAAAAILRAGARRRGEIE